MHSAKTERTEDGGIWYITCCMSKPSDHPAAASPEQLWTECQVRRLRRSGPGGQHRNKAETAVSLHHLPTGVRAEASERRSQAQNRTQTLFRLRVNLALEVRRPCGPDYVPSFLWQSRCGGGVLKLSRARRLPRPAGRGIGRAGRPGRRSEAGGCRAELHAVAVDPLVETRPACPGVGQRMASRTPDACSSIARNRAIAANTCLGI